MFNFSIVLKNKMFIGDITPDVNSEDLYNSLFFYSNYLSLNSSPSSFFDSLSGHGFYQLDVNSVIYFVQDTEIFRASHFHSPSFNFILNKNGFNYICDVGRLNYSKKYNYQTFADNHNSVYLNNNEKKFFLDFNFQNSFNNTIIFKLKSTHQEVIDGSLSITSFKKYFSLNYKLNFKNPVKVGFIFITPTTAFILTNSYLDFRLSNVESASNYGVHGDLFFRFDFFSEKNLFTFDVNFKIYL